MSTTKAEELAGALRVNIRPGVGILSVLRHLNYRPWFAMAEFVDNSLQSFLEHRHALQGLHGQDLRLKVEIEIERSDEMRIRIRDNAAGIATSDFARAFRPAELPADRSGLAEFGMGMKSAACWFAPRWKVRTSALGEPFERTISFDIDKIVRDDIQELDVTYAPAAVDVHYTEITLIDPYEKLLSKTGAKIKDHLASIYRIFLREEAMELWFSRDNAREKLGYETPKILVAPYFKTPAETPVRWYREFAFDFGLGLRASGFAALREVASTSTAGFALFRRNRLIEGSLDEPYRPSHIFGTGNSYRMQRLIGEIHLDGFDVSHTKDGFKWEEHEQPFLELLYEELEKPEMPMLSQAEGFRARVAQRELKNEAEKATLRVAETLAKEAPEVLERQSAAEPFLEPLPEQAPPDLTAASKIIEVDHRGAKWRIAIELAMDPAIEDWLTITDKLPSRGNAVREITVRMALMHPFMQRYCRADSGELEALARVAAAFGLAEITARDSGVPQYGTIRRNLNELLREALSKP
jgi:hypothetical protein